MKITNPLIIIIISVSFSLSSCSDAVKVRGEDSWYSYMHDQQNSGISQGKLDFPLHLNWQRKWMHAPEPAWPAPAMQDYYNGKGKLEPLVTYDRAFHPIVVRDKVFTASSANNSINCIDSDTGEILWQFFTDAPNRNAPLWYKENLYFGSDDGNLYCLRADNGTLLWMKRCGSARKLVGNGRVISSTPIRTGIVVKNDTVFLASGLLPEESVILMACDAFTGKTLWSHVMKDLAPQGYPVISDSLWYVPNSRVQPMAFNLNNGELSRQFKGLGGDYLSVVDGKLIYGTNWQGEINARNFLEAAMTGYKVIGNKNCLYIATDYSLNAVDIKKYTQAFKRRNELESQLKRVAEKIKAQRDMPLSQIDSLQRELEKVKDAEFMWQQEVSKVFGMIKTANAVIVSCQDVVKAFDAESGCEIWQVPVKGRAYGLAVCDHRLYVSTDKGYSYCFGGAGKEKYFSEEIDDAFYSSYGKGEKTMQRARLIKKYLPREHGIMLVCNANEGRLIHELSQSCNYYIIGVEENSNRVKTAKKQLDRAGVYGVRATMFKGKLNDLQFSDYMINVAVIDEKKSGDELSELGPELARILSPSGGRLLLTKNIEEEVARQFFKACFNGYVFMQTTDYWIFERPALPGSGVWTHLYANPANTVSTSDQYASDQVSPLWFGSPGPRDMSDRHHRAPSPLYGNGILFIAKDDGIIAADAYNGTLLWEKDISNFRRIKISRDAGNMALSNDLLYTVSDNFCFAYDMISGEEKYLFRVPQLKRTNVNTHWGYLATVDDMLFGSGRKPTAVFNTYSREDWSEYSRLVSSDYLFAMNRHTGKELWVYKGGVLLNPTICIGNGKIFFIESNNKEALNDEDGLMPFNVLKKDLNIVAVNSETGAVIWRKAFDFSLIEHILYGSYADGLLIMSGSGNKSGALWFGTYAFDADSGELKWQQAKEHLSWTNGSHGEQIHRAMIMDETVYIEPFAFDLKTGQQKEKWKLQRNGHACGTISGANGVIFFRGTNPAACVPNKTDQGTKLNTITRPGCWINMIPAGGVLLIPEASSGCACHFPLQMSIVYQPITPDK